MDRRLMRVEEVADKLGMARQTIYNRMSRNSKNPLPVKARKVGRSVRFDSREVEEYIDSLKALLIKDE